MFGSTMFCHVDNFVSTKLSISGSIQIWECALNKFNMDLVHESKLDICHLCGLGATYLEHFFVSIPMCIPFIISYIIIHQHLKFGFVKKNLDLHLRSLKLRSHFLGRFEGNWTLEVRD